MGKASQFEVFLIRIFPYSVRMGGYMDQKKLQIRAIFTQFLIDLQQPLLGFLEFLANRNDKRINNKDGKKRLDIIYVFSLF